MHNKKLRCFEICCGAGIFSKAFKSTGYKILGGIDIDKHAIETARYNLPEGKWKQTSIEEFSKHLRKDSTSLLKADIIISGLPCQGFSTAGMCDPDDYRNGLYKHLLKIVGVVKPQYVVVENVHGLTSARNRKVFKKIIIGLRSHKYDVDYRVYDAVNFSTPQCRKRVFIIASKKIPTRYIFSNVQFAAHQTTVRDALVNLSAKEENMRINHTFMKHGKGVVKKIKSINNGGPISYRRLKWNRPAVTIISGHNALPLHPQEHRAISNREAARLQGIPDGFIFKGPRTQQTVQIANAVPVPMAKAVAKAINIAQKTMKSSQGNIYKILQSKMEQKSKLFFRQGFINYFKKRGKQYKWRVIKKPYIILLTEILLQRTKSEMVSGIWTDFIKACNFNCSNNSVKLKRIFNKIGLHYKIKTIQGLNSYIRRYFKGKVPSNYDELINLPGVGIYIASATRTFAFNIPDFPVDSNCFRFINRFYGLKTKGKKTEARQIREFMNTVISKKNPKGFVYGFLDFCTDICTPHNPKCKICFLGSRCKFKG